MIVNESTHLDGFLLNDVFILKIVSEECIVTLTVHSIYIFYHDSVEVILEGKQNVLKVE